MQVETGSAERLVEEERPRESTIVPPHTLVIWNDMLETNNGGFPISDEALIVLSAFLHERQWCSRSDAYSHGLARDTAEPKRGDIYKKALASLVAVTYNQPPVSIIEHNGVAKGGARYRVAEALGVVDERSDEYQTQPEAGPNTLGLAERISLLVKEKVQLGEFDIDTMYAEGTGTQPTKRRPKQSTSSHGISQSSGHSRRDIEADDLVKTYLNDIGKHPLLNKEGEVYLSRAREIGIQAAAILEEFDQPGKAQALSVAEKRQLRRMVRAGNDAEEMFIQSNLRLVVSVAKKYQASGIPLLDLIQEGNLGLMHAVEKFDYRKGFKFSTYSTWWIRQAITRGIANTGRTIRLPVHAGDTLARVQKARLTLEIRYGRQATIQELASHVNLPESKVVEALRLAAEPLSLSEQLREDSDTTLGDVIEDRTATSPAEAVAEAALPGEIDRLLAPLTTREREVLKLRFGIDRGEPRTLEEVGAHFNVTRERIRQIEAKAFSKLRHPSSETVARELL